MGPASGHGECDYRSVGEMRTATSLRGRGVRDRVATTCVVMVFVLKSEGEASGREVGDKAEAMVA